MGNNEESGTPIYDLAHHAWGYQDGEKKDSTFLLAFLLLIIFSLLLSWVLAHKWHCKVLPEACVVLTVGMCSGFATKYAYKETHRGFFSRPLLGFDNALFFLGLLPPIIFYSGYELHPRWLFGLFYQIAGFAIVGTLVSSVIVGVVLRLAAAVGLAPGDITFAETLTFGALVSATDPVSVIAVFTELRVDPKMFYLVFGESVLNDAVGIVLFKTFAKFVGYRVTARSLALAAVDFVVIFTGSALVGVLVAAVTAVVLRALRSDGWNGEGRRRENPDEGAASASRTLQLVVLVCAVWAPTFVAELVELSGIVATLFAAIGVRHWGTPNLESSSHVDASKTAEALLSTLAHLADTVVFLYLGLSVPAKTSDWRKEYSHSLTFWAIVACLAGRAAHVYPLSRLINRRAKERKTRRRAPSEPAGLEPLGAPLRSPSSPDRERAESQQPLTPPAARPFATAPDEGEIPPAMQHMLWFSGLRGAVAFSCAHTFPNAHGHRTLFATTTIVLIITSMYLLGALTVPVLDALGIAQDCVLGADGAPLPPAAPPASDARRPSLARATSVSEAPPVAPLPLRTLQALDRHVYPLLVARPASPARRPPPPPRGDAVEMVDVAGDDVVDPLSPLNPRDEGKEEEGSFV